MILIDAVNKNDISHTWVTQSPDLLKMAQLISLPDFESELILKNCDFEFGILEKITNTNKHFEKLAKPDSKTQSLNRYFSVRVFEDSCVKINMANRRASGTEDEFFGNVSVDSPESDLNIHGQLFSDGLILDSKSQFGNVQITKKSSAFFEREKISVFHHLSNSLQKTSSYNPSKHMLPIPLIGNSKLRPSNHQNNEKTIDQIEEQSNENSPTHCKNKELKMNFRVKSPEKQSFDLTNISQEKLKKFEIDPFPMNLEHVSDENIVSFMNGDQYINASYIHHPYLLNVDKSMIVTQLPLSNTVVDFWTMVCENNTRVVVMLCSYQEVADEKPKYYFPKDKEVRKYGRFEISGRIESESEIFTLRKISVTNVLTGKSHQVSHYKVRNWADKENLSKEDFPNMLELVRLVIEEGQKKDMDEELVRPSMVVHCKAGLGRSGVFIAFYYILEYLLLVDKLVKTEHNEAINHKNIGVSVFTTVRKIRECRWGMVLSAKQYFNIYDFVLFAIRKLFETNQGFNFY